jgi:signal transduction histidine kinase
MRVLIARSLAAIDSVRMIYAGATLLAIGLIAINSVVIWHNRATVLEEQTRDMDKISLALAGQADRSLQSVDLVLQNLAERFAADGVDSSAALERIVGKPEAQALLLSKLTGLPQLDAITVINADGKLVNFTRYWPIPAVNIADRDYYTALKNNPALRTFVSEPVRNRGTGTWTIYLARRLSNADDEFVGLVLGAMSLDFFESYYSSFADAPGLAVALLRDDGTLLARYPPADGVGKQAFADVRDRFRLGESSVSAHEISPVDGQMRLRTARAVPSYPLISLVSITEEAALAEWRELAVTILGGALGGVAAIAMAAVAFARQMRQRDDLARARAARADAEHARSVAEAALARQQIEVAAFAAMKEAKEAAEAASRAKSEFLAMVSHELRTPLNAIIGFSDLMVQEVMGPLGATTYSDYARDINVSGAHLLGVINDIIDLTKAEAGMMVMRRDPVDVHALVTEVVRLMGRRAEAAGLELRAGVPENCVLHADERKLKQMMVNLLSNAIKFTKSGGRIEVDVIAGPQETRFVVRDTGIGIAAKNIDRVLTPFVQVDSSLARRHEGTGLGLPLAKAMAELHGGRLILESLEGEGTTATIILPTDSGAAVAVPSRPDAKTIIQSAA